MARRKQAGKDLKTVDNILPVFNTDKAGQDLPIVDNVPQLDSPADGYTRYVVTRSVSQLCHTEQQYVVKNGLVDLPTNETWYQPLIANGTLKGV